MSDLKTSILVNRQVPEFIREEYPLFISFLEAYYEYLETQQGTEINDLVKKSKDLRNVTDVDASIDTFESNFFNTYASLLPRDVQVDKDFLIKNILPLYLAKGNEKAFKLLFRMLFNDEVTILQPRNNVLRASDGRWTVDNVLRIDTDVRSVYTGDGSTTTFTLAQIVNDGASTVYIDDVQQESDVDYFIRRESKKIVFVTAPSNGSEVKVVYSDFDIELLTNRKITGRSSGATALVERAVPRIITDQLNFGLPFELFISNKTLLGSFFNGEEITTDIINDDGELINLVADTFSILTKINVIDGGASYNIGDPVTIVGGGAVTGATAEVGDVSTGFTSRIVVNAGGAGFKVASLISSSNTPGSTLISGAVDAVNSAHFTANTIVITDDIIDTYANVTIDALDYGFPGSFTENVSTRIADALTPLTITDLGPITNAVILFSNTSVNTAVLDSEGAIYQAGNSFFDIKSFKSVGRIDINDGGTGYNFGDEIIFGANPLGTYGVDAAAMVTKVAANGYVERIEIQAPRISGTANVLNNTVEIVGTGTSFDTELQIGDKIIMSNQIHYINAISSSTQANVNVAFSFTDGTIWSNNMSIGSYSKGLVGGVNYVANNLPTVTISTASGGSGANIAITALMGDGENLSALADTQAGQIQSIRLTSGGIGYQYIPQVDLTSYGDGTALANATLGSSYVTLPGRWTTSDSIISNSERKLQGDPYYFDYAYVTESTIQFSRYKQILKDLLHPAGFQNFALLNKYSSVAMPTTTISSATTDTVSGLIEVVNGSIYITGTNTKFVLANTNSILTVGSNVAVNGEIRTVNNIISNTNISVSAAFTTNASAQTLIIVT